jgi:eukaryotic-like serine/threonine-protein kinase
VLRQILNGKYRLVRLLGQGGMGSVYEAVEIATERRVAIKVITELSRASKRETLKARFHREVRAAMAIDSPHVVRVIEANVDPDLDAPFMAMEYLTGEDVEHLFEEVGTLPVDLALRLAGQVCLGLERAHAAGVVHRDIKPANLFLARGAEDGEVSVKLLDFGIAKIKMEQGGGIPTTIVTRTGSLLGSPLFMSPEQAQASRTIDHRTDIWSLGIVLYRALTGRTPHQDVETFCDLIMAICSVPVRPVSAFAPWVPAEVAAIAERALSLQPASRFPSVASMLKAIRAACPNGLSLRAETLAKLRREERARVAPKPGPKIPLRSAAQPRLYSSKVTTIDVHDPTAAMNRLPQDRQGGYEDP